MYLYIIIVLRFFPAQFFEKLQKEEWYFSPLKRWSEELGISRGDNILEIGSGPGIFTNLLHKNGVNVVGVDKSTSMISIAKKNGNAKFVLGNAEKLPFPSNTFDFTLSTSLINVLQNPKASISEMLRVTKKDGEISFIFPCKNMNKENAREMISKKNLDRFSRSALLFWVRNAKKMSAKSVKEILLEIDFLGDIKTNLYLSEMLMAVTIKKM